MMLKQHVNPYAPPHVEVCLERGIRRDVLPSLRVPSIGLIVLSVMWSGAALEIAIFFAVYLAVRFAQSGALRYVGPSGHELAQGLVVVPSILIAYGAWCMRCNKHYRVAVVAALIACIPLISPCLILGIPFGIWAILVLRRPDVRAAFARPNDVCRVPRG